MSNRNSKFLLAALFLITSVIRISRILPNFEFVTTAMVVSASLLSKKQSLLLILAIMAATDLILGNTNIFLFTWTGFLIPIFVIKKLKNWLKIKNLKIITPLGLGLASNIFFYLWTNFGVWFLDSWGMYPKTLPGLVSCYINGLPFLKTQAESTLIFVPLTLILINFIYSRLAKSAYDNYIIKSWTNHLPG